MSRACRRMACRTLNRFLNSEGHAKRVPDVGGSDSARPYFCLRFHRKPNVQVVALLPSTRELAKESFDFRLMIRRTNNHVFPYLLRGLIPHPCSFVSVARIFTVTTKIEFRNKYSKPTHLIAHRTPTPPRVCNHGYILVARVVPTIPESTNHVGNGSTSVLV